MKTTPPRHGRGGVRLTRRGRLAVTVTCALIVASLIAVGVTLMAPDEKRQRPQSLTIADGWRASEVYEAVDRALAVPAGTTKGSLARARLTLPPEARGNPEGYLLPATYPITEQTTPESLLTAMVDAAGKHVGESVAAAGAMGQAVHVYQSVTIASIVQAEATTTDDMGKVARIIYNRLARGMPLQMDSTINYALNRSPVHTSEKDTKLDSPYNSYTRLSLPPTPIGNPGKQAVRAAINPTPGDWLYFVAVKPGDTRFTSSYEEQVRNVAEFNRLHQATRVAS